MLILYSKNPLLSTIVNKKWRSHNLKGKKIFADNLMFLEVDIFVPKDSFDDNETFG